MDDPLKEFLQKVRSAFFAGDFETLSRYCAMPLVVYSAAGVVTITDSDALTRLADRYRQVFINLPITHGECRIVQHDATVNHRLRVTARWDEFGEGNKPLTSSLVRYFLVEKGPNIWLIEMLEYLEMAISVEDAERILH